MSYVALCPYVEPLFAVSVFRPYSWMCVCMYVAPYFNRTFVGIASVRLFRGGGPLFASHFSRSRPLFCEPLFRRSLFLDVCMYVCRSVFQYDFCWHCVGSLFSRRRATFREPLFAVAATFTGAFLMDAVGFPQEVILGCVDVCPSIFQ